MMSLGHNELMPMIAQCYFVFFIQTCYLCIGQDYTGYIAYIDLDVRYPFIDVQQFKKVGFVQKGL